MLRRLFFLILSTGMVFAEQTILITFERNSTTKHSKEKSGNVHYNKLYIPDKTSGYYKTELSYTDGSDSTVSISVKQSGPSDSDITDFKGDYSAIYTIFPENSIHGILSYDSKELLYLWNLPAGSYTLYILGARGNHGLNKAMTTTYGLSVSGENLNVSASVVAYCTAEGKTPPEVDDGKIKAYTINTDSTKNLASNWVLMKFDFILETELEKLAICASGNNGNIAAVALTTIPEPTTPILSILALALLTGRRRRTTVRS